MFEASHIYIYAIFLLFGQTAVHRSILRRHGLKFVIFDLVLLMEAASLMLELT